MRGALVAGSAFVVILALAVVGLIAARSFSTSPSAVSPTAAIEAAGGIPVAVVADDVTLGGHLWPGGSTGVLIVVPYGESATPLIPLATHAQAAGATTMLLDPRGQGSSGGSLDQRRLVGDIGAAVADLRTRGTDNVVIVGIRHTATAALVASVDPPDGVSATVAFFPFEQYQGVDAIGSVARATVPLTIVGVGDNETLGPWAGRLGLEAPTGTRNIQLPGLPTDARFVEFYRDDMATIIMETIADTAD